MILVNFIKSIEKQVIYGGKAQVSISFLWLNNKIVALCLFLSSFANEQSVRDTLVLSFVRMSWLLSIRTAGFTGNTISPDWQLASLLSAVGQGSCHPSLTFPGFSVPPLSSCTAAGGSSRCDSTSVSGLSAFLPPSSVSPQSYSGLISPDFLGHLRWEDSDAPSVSALDEPRPSVCVTNLKIKNPKSPQPWWGGPEDDFQETDGWTFSTANVVFLP